MAKIKFSKMEGAGNDFVVIDNRAGLLPQPLSAFVAWVCDRHRGVGADGLLLLEKSVRKAFRMVYYNGDGSEADMCGNGARCLVRFAQEQGAAEAETDFENRAGDFKARKINEGMIEIDMTKPHSMKLGMKLNVEGREILGHFLNTGVPHFVVPVSDVETVDVLNLGRALRRHETFAPQGSNVNFVQVVDRGHAKIRTYERGVENETLACGTGITAAAVLLAHAGLAESPLTLKTRGNDDVTIRFEKSPDGADRVSMSGPAILAFVGEIDLEDFMRRPAAR